MKVSIIGGGGRVGGDAAYALQLGGIVREIALVDIKKDMAEGEALDLRHGASLTSSQKFYASDDYDVVRDSDFVVITAGLRREPKETRISLAGRNVASFLDVLSKLKQVRLNPGAVLLAVANPVDILTHVGAGSGVFEPGRVLGLGTVLDTCRFRSLLAEKFNVNPTEVNALVLGEHGDTMVPILVSNRGWYSIEIH